MSLLGPPRHCTGNWLKRQQWIQESFHFIIFSVLRCYSPTCVDYNKKENNPALYAAYIIFILRYNIVLCGLLVFYKGRKIIQHAVLHPILPYFTILKSHRPACIVGYKKKEKTTTRHLLLHIKFSIWSWDNPAWRGGWKKTIVILYFQLYIIPVFCCILVAVSVNFWI